MRIRRQLILFVSVGFLFVSLAAVLGRLPVHWRGLLVFSGGWLMAVGVLYQVRLYAGQKDTRYYVLLVFAGAFWLSMTAATLFWLVRRWT